MQADGGRRARLDPRLRGRVGGPGIAVVIDLVAHSFVGRHWLVLALVVLAAVAATVIVVGQAVVPLLVYPAL